MVTKVSVLLNVLGKFGKYTPNMDTIGLMTRVFAIGLGDWDSIPDRVIPKTWYCLA